MKSKRNRSELFKPARDAGVRKEHEREQRKRGGEEERKRGGTKGQRQANKKTQHTNKTKQKQHNTTDEGRNKGKNRQGEGEGRRLETRTETGGVVNVVTNVDVAVVVYYVVGADRVIADEATGAAMGSHESSELPAAAHAGAPGKPPDPRFPACVTRLPGKAHAKGAAAKG
jgi:hypothetical protein